MTISPQVRLEEDRPDVFQESESSHTPQRMAKKPTKEFGIMHGVALVVHYSTVNTTSRARCPESRSNIETDSSNGS